MLLTGIDLETTSLNTATARIIEVGAVLWDWDTRQPLELCSTLVFDPDYPELEPEVEAVTGLNRNILARHGIPSAVAFHTVESIVNHSSYYVAHNGSIFDKLVWESETTRQGASTIGKPWIDTTIDVPYPKHITTRKLTHLAAEHGFLNPFAHRAVFDVLTMLRVASCYSLDEILALQTQPIVQVQALVSFHSKDLAKNRGYRWFPIHKLWIKTMKSGAVEQEIKEAEAEGFRAILLSKWVQE